MRVSLIDADSIVHIVAYNYCVPKAQVASMTELYGKDTEEYAAVLKEVYESMNKEAVMAHIDSFISDIIDKTEGTHYLGFLGHRDSPKTFRHRGAVTKPYKGNRGPSSHWVKFWKPHMMEHMVTKWGFMELKNIEADDAVAMCAVAYEGSVICSPDKDLRQVPGAYYDYKKQEHGFVEPFDALKFLYKQILVGDSTDNITGCKGVGAKSPHLEFPGCFTQKQLHEYACKVYQDKKCLGIMAEQIMLVFMLRKPDGVDIKEIPQPIERKFLGDKTNEFVQEDNNEPLLFTQ